jgi:nitrous oxide reductase accessory protein NosL
MKKLLPILLPLVLLGCSGEGSDKGKQAAPVAAARGLTADGQMRIGPADRCPVCAMKAAEHPKFSSAIELDDGRAFYFCGTGCLIRSWLHPEVHLGVDRSHLGRAVTRDYFKGEQIDAERAIWVAGSDVVGPMGPALVPLKTGRDAETFKERHGGEHTFRLAEMTDDRWREITGKPSP